MRRILLVLSVAALMAAMLVATAMPALATHECTKDEREGIQKALSTKGQQWNLPHVGASVCYNAGGDNDFGPTGVDYGDPGLAGATPAKDVD